MCGIVGHTGHSPNLDAVLAGLKRLEYRGYDSAGVAGANGKISAAWVVGKIHLLETHLKREPLPTDAIAHIGHTRWATHGPATKANAHPHTASMVAVVHNGIIENHAELRSELESAGFVFSSDTDTEVVTHLIEQALRHEPDLIAAVQQVVPRLQGAYALGIISPVAPDTIIAVRKGSPLAIGLGDGQNMIGSDALAIAEHTPEVMYLNDGDLAVVTPESVQVLDQHGQAVTRPTKHVDPAQLADKGDWRHYMLKEMHEQPDAVRNTLDTDISAFGEQAADVLSQVQAIHIVACGTSHYAGQQAKRWFTKLGIPCDVFIASEYMVDDALHVPANTLCIAISQSGETADTRSAIKQAKSRDYLATMAICNTDGSSVVRETDLCFLTKAGHEQAVASTKAFTTQLIALQLLAYHLGNLRDVDGDDVLQALRELPLQLEAVLKQSAQIKQTAQSLMSTTNAFFLGKRHMSTIAAEGALKLQEISYIHAQAYPAGEMKHGPIALVEPGFLTVVIVPKDELEQKTISSISEVLARQSSVLVFAEDGVELPQNNLLQSVSIGTLNPITAPYIANVALQLFAYHMAVAKGTDVDQPRNLAKSVTVE